MHPALTAAHAAAVHAQRLREAAYQAFGGVAIVLGLFGTWLVAQRRAGWVLCIVSSMMWFPALVTGDQWAAVVNCSLSIGICLRNFRAYGQRSRHQRSRSEASRLGSTRATWHDLAGDQQIRRGATPA